jgi:heat shock protein HslJ
MHKIRTSLAVLASLALGASLATAVAAQDEATTMDAAAPEGVTWILQQQAVDGPALLEQLPRLVTASLLMEDGAAGGNAGCNSWFGDYELDGQSLTFGPVGSTMMLCQGPAMAVEETFLANLSEVASWAIDSTELTLSDADGNALMRFAEAPAATVVGSWVTQGINNGAEAVETNEYTSRVTAIFDPEGRLAGNDGCNNYMTSYEVDAESITISPSIATTMMACAEPALDELSSQYFAALLAATTWSVDASGALELRDASGALQVRYVPAE